MSGSVTRGENGRVDQRAIRRANLSAVLRHVATDGPRSRARIALETGLNKTTVSSLVSELIAAGLLVETGEEEQPGAVGRPARTVRLNGEAVAAARARGQRGLPRGLRRRPERPRAAPAPRRGRQRAQPPGAGAGPPRPARPQRDRRGGGRGARIVGAALGLPGLVDLPGSTLVVAPNLGWRDVDAAAHLARRLDTDGLAVGIDNEANLAALAEHWEGAARQLRTFVCVTGDVGIGAGVLVGGELFRGTHGFGGELGHIMVDPDGEPCACGSRGCLETVAGQAAVMRRAGGSRRAPAWPSSGRGPGRATSARSPRSPRPVTRSAWGSPPRSTSSTPRRSWSAAT